MIPNPPRRDDDGEITAVMPSAGPEIVMVNDQPVVREVVELAKRPELPDNPVDTAVVSFFDVGYVRSEELREDPSERAKDRLSERRADEARRLGKLW